MTHVRVECPSCGQKAWKPKGSSTMYHAGCPKRGGSRNASPIYREIPKTEDQA